MITAKTETVITIVGERDITSLANICEMAKLYMHEAEDRPIPFDVPNAKYMISELLESIR